MKNECIKLFIILFLDVATISLLTLLNSDISSLGIFLYLPALFFFNSSLYLNYFNGIIVSIIIGLFLDEILSTPLGFHAIFLCLAFITGKSWIEYNTKRKLWRLVTFQLLINIFFTIILFGLFLCKENLGVDWSYERFLIDLIISSIIFIPICFWKIEISRVIIQMMFEDTKNSEDLHEIK